MRDIDLNLLRHLAMLLQTGSVSGAAARLGISQPAMSRSLTELRRQLGDPLLIRTGNGMLPTRRAEQLAEPLQRWLAEASAMVVAPAFNPSQLARRFAIAANHHAVRAAVAPALAAILAAAPAVTLDIVPEAGEPRAQLAAGEADLVLSHVPANPQLLHDRLLLSEPFACLMRADHPLLNHGEAKPLGVDDLLTWPRVALGTGDRRIDPLAEARADRASEGCLIATLPCAEAAAELLAGSDAVLVLPAAAARRAASDPRLGLIAARGTLGTFALRALWHNRVHRDPAVHWLIDLLARHCGGEARGDLAGSLPLLQAAE